jgi:hypothetical protein
MGKLKPVGILTAHCFSDDIEYIEASNIWSDKYLVKIKRWDTSFWAHIDRGNLAALIFEEVD